MRTALKVSEIQVIRNLLQHENLYGDREEYEKFVIRYLGFLDLAYFMQNLNYKEQKCLLYRIEVLRLWYRLL
jgi:hypothetical protein